MINGRVTGAQRILTPLEVQDGNGNWRTLPIALDTGFTGYLALPERYVLRLGLTLDGRRLVSSATQQSAAVRYGYARIVWFGQQRTVRVLQAGTHPLLGMSLLRNHHIAVDAVANGAVSITPLQSQ